MDSRQFSVHDAAATEITTVLKAARIRHMYIGGVWGQGGKDTKQKDVADEVARLRRQIKELTKLAKHHDKWDLESLPSTVIRSLDVAIALDNSASGKVDDSSSGFRSSGTEEPIERVKKWV